MVPSVYWKIIPERSSIRLDRLFFLSSLKKKRPSSRRARKTRSWPLTASSLSLISVLLTATKTGINSPFSSTTGKYFWCSRMEVINASSGRARNFSSKEPHTPQGISTRLVTVSTKPSSSTALPLSPMRSKTAFSTSSITSARLCVGSAITDFSASSSR